MAETTKKTVSKKVESMYSVAELVNASDMLKSTKDLVATALKLDGKEHYSLSQAKEIVQQFSSKKIK